MENLKLGLNETQPQVGDNENQRLCFSRGKEPWWKSKS